MKCAIDIQNIQEFEKQVNKSTGQLLLDNIFFPEEVEGLGINSIAGRFCVKECLIKVGIIGVDDWKLVKIITDKPGEKPRIESVSEDLVLPDLDFSISHSGDYVVAMLVVNTRD